ncbi:MAG: glycosyltransferase, partial [Gemmatimonadetes bacterium]|nr:glycosyltransferase family 4 protein [Gemmatimonadota bacterium]NIT66082.1 glycosyltransferase family 4 protein [Gemmatimonadota bacterium]NIY34660.1 glycosyltransferase [Gemmatimonadota bacterium]
SPVGVIRDIVIPEETGLWATTDDEWADAMERVLRAPDRAKRMGAQGRGFIEDRYSVRSALPTLIQAFQDAAKAPAGPETEVAACAASPAS